MAFPERKMLPPSEFSDGGEELHLKTMSVFFSWLITIEISSVGFPLLSRPVGCSRCCAAVRGCEHTLMTSLPGTVSTVAYWVVAPALIDLLVPSRTYGTYRTYLPGSLGEGRTGNVGPDATYR